MAPQVLEHPGARPTEKEPTVDIRESSASAHPSTEDQDEHPHVCNDGWVTLGQLVVDPETGEETEEHALYLCRRCADSR
jgi:hypothetical protein